jgi:autoinducer 2 (AI-2) kinase
VRSEDKYLLVLDAGSGGAKCSIFNTEGKWFGTTVREWDRSHWDPKNAWDSFRVAIKDLFEVSKVAPEKIVAVTSTSMREDIVIVGKDLQEIVFNLDQRVFKVGIPLEEQYGEKIYLRTGHWPTTGWMAPSKLVFLREFEPEKLKNASKVLMVNDWILFKLTGKMASEPSNACTSCFLDIEKIDWCWDIIQDIKLPKEIFPEILKNGEVLGEVSEKASRETGLKEGTLVVLGGADAQCGALGTGAINEGDTVAVGGTTTPILMILSKPIVDREYRVWSGLHVNHGQWFLESNAGATGWLYRWFRDNFATLEVAASKVTGVNAFAMLDKEAEMAPIGSRGLIASIGAGIMDLRKKTDDL